MTKPRASTDEDLATAAATYAKAVERITAKAQTGHWPPVEAPCRCGGPECTEKVGTEAD